MAAVGVAFRLIGFHFPFSLVRRCLSGVCASINLHRRIKCEPIKISGRESLSSFARERRKEIAFRLPLASQSSSERSGDEFSNATASCDRAHVRRLPYLAMRSYISFQLRLQRHENKATNELGNDSRSLLHTINGNRERSTKKGDHVDLKFHFENFYT